MLDPRHQFTLLRKDRIVGRGGGVCVFVNRSISIVPLSVDSKYDDLEIIMAALCNRGAIIFLPCSFFLSFFFLSVFSTPNLSGRRSDVYHTSTHGVALVRI